MRTVLESRGKDKDGQIEIKKENGIGERQGRRREREWRKEIAMERQADRQTVSWLVSFSQTLFLPRSLPLSLPQSFLTSLTYPILYPFFLLLCTIFFFSSFPFQYDKTFPLIASSPSITSPSLPLPPFHLHILPSLHIRPSLPSCFHAKPSLPSCLLPFLPMPSFSPLTLLSLSHACLPKLL